MFILDECKEFEHIVSWSDDGMAFILHDAVAFEDQVLPEIFKEARFSSFLRKVSIGSLSGRQTEVVVG